MADARNSGKDAAGVALPKVLAVIEILTILAAGDLSRGATYGQVGILDQQA